MIPYSSAIHGMVLHGEKEGLGGIRHWVRDRGDVMQHSTASINDSRWSDTQPNSSHYHESTGWVERCEKRGEWAKRAETEADNPWWKIRSGAISHIQDRLKQTHTPSVSKSPIKMNINASYHFSLLSFHLPLASENQQKSRSYVLR